MPTVANSPTSGSDHIADGMTGLVLKNKISTHSASTLNLFYKQQRFWATSLKLEWLLILVA